MSDLPESKITKDHLKIERDKLPELVLLPGAPERVYEICRYLEKSEIVGKNREFTTAVGKYKDVELTVCSTGIGGTSAEIALVELKKRGIKKAIRIGTSGGIQDDMAPGDLVILSACAKYSGACDSLVPVNFPAVSDYEMIMALIEGCETVKATYHVGIGATVDSFYGSKISLLDSKLKTTPLYERLPVFRQLNVLLLDMESAPLFTLGSILNVKVGSICTIGGNLYKKYEQKEVSNEKAILAALDAALHLSQWDLLAERYKVGFKPSLLGIK
ncbi:MAG: uridine phosphorylase [Kosmotogales bacterium]|nr:uridine phosphorylase [Kosmotogales bacterium]